MVLCDKDGKVVKVYPYGSEEQQRWEKDMIGKKIKREGKFYVYIVECSDRTFYTGYTNDLDKRLKEHNDGKRGARYIKYKRPVELVWKKEYKYFKLATKEERRIKALRRWQKEELIHGKK